MRRFAIVAAMAALAFSMTPARVVLAQGNSGAPTTIDGTVSMLVEDDFLGGHANKRYFVDDSTTKRITSSSSPNIKAIRSSPARRFALPAGSTTE